MFEANVYIQRRNQLRSQMKSGLVLILGNNESPMNYPSNTYHFRQDSNFLYFFGVNQAGYAGVIDIDNGKDYLFGNDLDLDDIIWMGPQPSVEDWSIRIGALHGGNLVMLDDMVSKALKAGKLVHFTPPYRMGNMYRLSALTGIHWQDLKSRASIELIKAIVNMRSVKEDIEIKEIEKAIDTAYLMHTTAMKMAKAGVVEREIAGVIEGIALSHGGPVSFPVILSINGHILHNHHHGNTLKNGDILVIDAGCETELNYASDITRAVPVGGKFSARQKEIYEIVYKAQQASINGVKPGVMYKDMHLLAAKTIASGLKEIGLMKGDVEEAVAQGAHALFFPHGLGHMLGIDVHDMEDLGENYVGYDETVTRSDQFGLAFLRLARKLQKGFVFTNEPGIYFIPALIDQWKAEKKHDPFINYDMVENYRNFGGIRLEDDILVTDTGHRILGRHIPNTIQELEEIMR